MKKSITAIVCCLMILSLCPFAAAQEAPKAEGAAAAPTATPIQIKQIEPFTYCCIEMTGSYEQHSTAFMTLYGAVGSQALNPEGEPFGVYHNDPKTTPEAELKWELGMPIAQGLEVKEPLKLKKWYFEQLAARIYEGPFDAMDAAYMEMVAWIEENGYVFAGPPMEKFLGMPAQDETGQWAGKMEIMIPVKKVK
jgi:effector-binding domain-containing protein